MPPHKAVFCCHSGQRCHGCFATWQVPAKEDRAERSIWALRNREEAERFWDSEFGHLRRDEGVAQEQTADREEQQEDPSRKDQQSFVASWNMQHSPAIAAAVAALQNGHPAPSPEQAQMRPTTGRTL